MIMIQLLIGIAIMKYRGVISERCLSSLTAYAKDYGVTEVLSWIKEDSGLLSVPSWQFEILVTKEVKYNNV